MNWSLLFRFLTQMGIGLYNACGPVSGAMVRNAIYRYEYLSPLQMAARIGNNGGFSTASGVIKGLRVSGVPSHYEGNATIQFYLDALAAGYTPIALVAYIAFSNRPYDYRLAHWMPITNITDTLVTGFDPIRTAGPYYFPRDEFERSIRIRSAYPGGTNNPYQAIVPEIRFTETDLLLGQMRNVLDARAA